VGPGPGGARRRRRRRHRVGRGEADRRGEIQAPAHGARGAVRERGVRASPARSRTRATTRGRRRAT
jgi:hypothetical protein